MKKMKIFPQDIKISKCLNTIRAFRMEKILKEGPIQSQKFISLEFQGPTGPLKF